MSSTSTGGSTVASPRPGRSKGRAAAFAALTAGIVVAVRRSDLWARRHFYASIVYLPALFLLLMYDKVSP